MTSKDYDFLKWMNDVENRLVEFLLSYKTETVRDAIILRNVRKYDIEVKRLRYFNHPCAVCNLPLHLTNNFRVYDVGDVCGVCYSMYTAINSNTYFYSLHKKEALKNGSGSDGFQTTA